MLNRARDIAIWGLILLGLGAPTLSSGADYKKATEGKEVVMNKLYPKASRFELDVPQMGYVMNNSYVNTVLIGGAATYFMSENLGFGMDVAIGQNNDKDARKCVESFYLDPENEVGASCGGSAPLADNNDPDGFPRYGPAYVPVREIQQMLIANIVWAPVYGKQLFVQSYTSYFDLYLELGLGFSNSKFYPKQDKLKNGNEPRGKYSDPDVVGAEVAAVDNAKHGAKVSETNSYGDAGRPTPRDEGNVVLNLGLGQKFHFGKVFHVKLAIRNMTLLGTEQGFDNYIVISGGLGFRF